MRNLFLETNELRSGTIRNGGKGGPNWTRPPESSVSHTVLLANKTPHSFQMKCQIHFHKFHFFKENFVLKEFEWKWNRSNHLRPNKMDCSYRDLVTLNSRPYLAPLEMMSWRWGVGSDRKKNTQSPRRRPKCRKALLWQRLIFGHFYFVFFF